MTGTGTAIHGARPAGHLFPEGHLNSGNSCRDHSRKTVSAGLPGITENRGRSPMQWGSASVPYRFYPLVSGSGGTGALKSFVPTGSITEECSRANPGGWGLSTESLLYWKRPPCIATTVSSPKGQGRIQFRRGTTADPDPVEYLLRLTILIYWQGKILYEYNEKH
jgi:hypothetical protein